MPASTNDHTESCAMLLYRLSLKSIIDLYTRKCSSLKICPKILITRSRIRTYVLTIQSRTLYRNELSGQHVTSHKIHVTSHKIHVTSQKIHVKSYKIHVTKYMSQDTCHILQDTCHILQDTCHILHVTKYMSHLKDTCHILQDTCHKFTCCKLKNLHVVVACGEWGVRECVVSGGCGSMWR